VSPFCSIAYLITSDCFRETLSLIRDLIILRQVRPTGTEGAFMNISLATITLLVLSTAVGHAQTTGEHLFEPPETPASS
jgi:hypothetical protein